MSVVAAAVPATGDALLGELSRLAGHLQRSRTVDEVLATVGPGLQALGLHSVILEQVGSTIVVRKIVIPDALRAELERAFDRSLEGLTLLLDELAVIPRLLHEAIPQRVPGLAAFALRALRNRFDVKNLDEQLFSAVDVAYVAPILRQGQIWGLLLTAAERIEDADTTALSLFTTQVSTALEIVGTIEDLEQRNRQLAGLQAIASVSRERELARVVPPLLEVFTRATRSDRGAIELDEAVRIGTEENVVLLRLLRSNAPLAARNGKALAHAVSSLDEPARSNLLTAGIHELAVVSMWLQGRQAGTIYLCRDAPRPFGDEELRSIELFASQAAIQLENARLYSESCRQVEHLSMLFALGHTIAASTEVKPLTSAASQLLFEALSASAVGTHLVREGRLQLTSFRGEPNEAPASIRELAFGGMNAHGRAAIERRTVVERIEFEEQPSAGPYLAVVVPLLTQDRLIGTLCAWREERRPFQAEELRLIESTASQLGVAIEHVRLFEEERRRARELALVNEFGASISEHLEQPALLKLAIASLTKLIDADSVCILLRPPGGNTLTMAAHNLVSGAPDELRIPITSQGVSAIAFRERQPILVVDVEEDERISFALARRFAYRSMIAAPLVVHGEAIGVLIIGESRPGRRLSTGEVDRTVAITNQLSAAIANARLYEQERRRVRELSLLSELGRMAAGTLDRERLLADALHLVANALDFEDGGVFLMGQAGELELSHRLQENAARLGFLEELASSAARSRTSASSSREQEGELLHGCAVTLGAGQRTLGVLVLARPDRPATEGELRALAACGPELGVALENVDNFEQSRRRVEELRLLLDIGRVITGSLDLDQILEASAGVLTRMVDASNCFVMLLDPAARQLLGSATSNPTFRSDFRKVRLLLDEPSIPTRCVRTRAAIVEKDTAPATTEQRQFRDRYGSKSVLALPLLVRDEPIGCVVIDDTRRPRNWETPEIERAAVIAHQLAVAVANARLFEDLKRSYGELARAQEELVKRERMAALGELAAVMAHEVRNPLGVIFNSLGSLRKILNPKGDAAMLLDVVGEESDRLNRIIGDLLDFARPNEPALQAEPLEPLIEDALHAVIGDPQVPNLQTTIDLDPSLPTVLLDARMIRQALLNVIMNAVQAMPRGGHLVVRATAELRARRTYLRIDVSDTGPGIPTELAERIFQPFFTTKASGTGLGLAVVKRIVEAHHGELSVESRAGTGSVFTLRLPMEEPTGD